MNAILGFIIFLLNLNTEKIESLKAGDIIYYDKIIGNLIYVPPTGPEGFIQGSAFSEKCRRKDERSFQHILTNPLAFMETEVTSKMWEELSKILKNFPPDPTNPEYGKGDEYPVQSVTFREAILFSNELSKLRNLKCAYYSDKDFKEEININNYLSSEIFWDKNSDGYRLPTEGEWEYAYRSGTNGTFFFEFPDYEKLECFSCPEKSIPVLDRFAWYCSNSGRKTHPVKTLLPNNWNIYGMAGNVREWCWDFQDDYPEGCVVDYAGPPSGKFRVARGGSAFTLPRALRAANRYGGSETARGWGVGFRLVRTLKEKDLIKYKNEKN